MNPLLARADELEKQRRQAEVIRGMTAGMSPAMTTQMTDEQRAILEQQAAQDPATKEAMMAEMLRTGSDALFNTGVAQGKTIGDIYVAPTWSESLNAAAKQGIGGYQMGKARRGLEEAQATRNEASTAKGTLSNALRKEQQDQLEWEKAAKLRAEALQERELAADIEANKAAAQLAADERAENRRRWEAEYGLKAGEAERKRAKDAADGTGKDKPDSVTARKLATEEAVFSEIDNVIGDYYTAKEANPELELGRKGTDWLAEKVESVPLIGGETAANVVANAPIVGYSKEEQELRGRIDGSVEKYRRAFTGANLTLIEKLLGTNWDPTAKGISTDQKISRLEALQGVLNSNRAAWDLEPLKAKSTQTNQVPNDGTSPVADDDEEGWGIVPL